MVAFSEADTPPRASAVRKGGAQLPVAGGKKVIAGCSKTGGGESREGRSLATARSTQISEEPALDEKRMRNILKGFGEYPEKYRCVCLCLCLCVCICRCVSVCTCRYNTYVDVCFVCNLEELIKMRCTCLPNPATVQETGTQMYSTNS